jgi:hypothetical protein
VLPGRIQWIGGAWAGRGMHRNNHGAPHGRSGWSGPYSIGQSSPEDVRFKGRMVGVSEKILKPCAHV